ncbi:MAG: chemotaxis protein, partial [Massilia sp.]|nr:chemotaxis protein [Massilia sp.]
QMDDMTQQNAALVEQAAAAAASLHDQTIKLAQAVSMFKFEGVDEPGDGATPQADEDPGFYDPDERRSQHSGMRGAAQRAPAKPRPRSKRT